MFLSTPIGKLCGVAIFKKHNIQYAICSDLSTFNEHAESVLIEINNDVMTYDRNILIVVIYRTPNTNIKHKLQVL